jgi:His/Glu/Gln/Arg/opine family amino acid ABC transporter permease subunit
MINLSVLQASAFWNTVLQGFIITVALTILSMTFGVMVGTGLACMQTFGNALMHYVAKFYIFVFRGIPLLVLLFLVYYGLPRVPWFGVGPFWNLILISPFRTAVFVLSINNAAYLGEIVRGGLIMVPQGLVEAGNAVGMTKMRVFFRIQAPIAFRSILGNLGSETIAVVKASAVTSVITVHDLMGGPTVIGKVYLDPFTPLIVVGVFYVLLVQGIDWIVGRTRLTLSAPGSVPNLH